jgi:hypothetical protein
MPGIKEHWPLTCPNEFEEILPGVGGGPGIQPWKKAFRAGT